MGAPIHMLDDAVRDYYGRDKSIMRFLDDASEMIACLLFRSKDSRFNTFSTGLNLFGLGDETCFRGG